jgi:hypothetical protein
MVDRYLSERDAGPDDGGLAGHADADEGPEGPPQHVSPAIASPEQD